MEADCDRCLETARHPLESTFDLFYRPAPSGARPARSRKRWRSMKARPRFAFYEGGGLELKDILREHILLSMPMQRICGEACKGICPVCGQNRNTGACDCQAKPADDRWAALEEFERTKGI